MGGLIAFLGIIVMIVLHEWGHFIAARIFKVPVYEFAIGMGPKLFSRKGKKGTIFSLRAVPIGGFCAFDDAKDSGIQDAALERIPVWQKIIICLAGPVMNLLIGYIIFLILIATIGIGAETSEIAKPLKGYPAYEVLEENDEIIKINGNDIIVGDENANVTYYIKNSNGEPLNIEFIRNGEILEETITPKWDETENRYMIGILTKNEYRKATIKEVFELPVKLTINSVKQVYVSLFNLVTGKNKIQEMSGIIGIVAVTNDYASKYTIFSFVSILAVISINLGIMNLLPIPGLDGSKIVSGIFELITKKKIPEKISNAAITGAFILLIVLMIYVAFNDIIKIIFK